MGWSYKCVFQFECMLCSVLIFPFFSLNFLYFFPSFTCSFTLSLFFLSLFLSFLPFLFLSPWQYLEIKSFSYSHSMVEPGRHRPTCSNAVSYSGLPRTVSSQIFNASEDRDFTTSLGILFQYSITVSVKKKIFSFV